MKDAYYFSHDSNARNDQRIIKLRRKLGAEGYGIYFMLIEILRDQVGYRLGLDDDILENISYDLRVDMEKVEDIVLNYEPYLTKKFNVQILPDLTPGEIKTLADQQAAAGFNIGVN